MKRKPKINLIEKMRLFHIQIDRQVNAQGKFNSTNAYTRKKLKAPNQ